MTEIILYHKDWCWAYRTGAGEMECPPFVRSRADIESYFAGTGISWSIQAGQQNHKILAAPRHVSFPVLDVRQPECAPSVATASRATAAPVPASPARRDPRGRHAKEVHQYTLDGKYVRSWPSLSSAADTLGISHGTISNCIKGLPGSHSAGGFRWSGKRMGRLPYDQTRERTSCQMYYAKYDLDGNRLAVYPSAKVAAKASDVTPTGIAQCFTGRQKSSAGCQWRRAFSAGDLPESVEPLSRAFSAGKIQPKPGGRL